MPVITPFNSNVATRILAVKIEKIVVMKYEMNSGFVFSRVLKPIDKGIIEYEMIEIIEYHINI